MFSHEVHMGRSHTNILDCGLCDAEFNKLEDLNHHLTTCEVYMCRYCRTKETTLFDIKKHVKENHIDGATIDQAKSSRRSKDQFPEKMYWDYDL